MWGSFWMAFPLVSAPLFVPAFPLDKNNSGLIFLRWVNILTVINICVCVRAMREIEVSIERERERKGEREREKERERGERERVRDREGETETQRHRETKPSLKWVLESKHTGHTKRQKKYLRQ